MRIFFVCGKFFINEMLGDLASLSLNVKFVWHTRSSG